MHDFMHDFLDFTTISSLYIIRKFIIVISPTSSHVVEPCVVVSIDIISVLLPLMILPYKCNRLPSYRTQECVLERLRVDPESTAPLILFDFSTPHQYPRPELQSSAKHSSLGIFVDRSFHVILNIRFYHLSGGEYFARHFRVWGKTYISDGRHFSRNNTRS